MKTQIENAPKIISCQKGRETSIDCCKYRCIKNYYFLKALIWQNLLKVKEKLQQNVEIRDLTRN